MLFDTDVFIWLERGNLKAAKAVEQEEERFLSIQSYMELLQGARNKKHHERVKSFLTDFNFIVLPLTENIGHRALIYVEEHTLSHHLTAADAIIAATAVENNLVLLSGNAKHFKPIKDLKFNPFIA
jgi:predicted nucleic acid-binding protein